MNFYGSESGDKHTLAGRWIPLAEAFDHAIKKAANQPLGEYKQGAQLPVWGHKICDQLTKTLFKNVVGLAPQGKFDARGIGRSVGMLLRGVNFVYKEANAELKRAGLLDLSPKEEQKLEELTGLPVVFQAASEQWQKPIGNEGELIDATKTQLQSFALKQIDPVLMVMKHLANASVEEQHEFLCGIPEGFIALLDHRGDFATKGRRHELYFLLLMHWPEISEMQNAQPPKTRRDLLDWLEKREGRQLVEDAKQFFELCADIELELAPPGRPPKVSPE